MLGPVLVKAPEPLAAYCGLSQCPRLDERAHLADAAAQVAVAGGDDVAAVLPHALADAVVRVRARVRARQPLYARVLQAETHARPSHSMHVVCARGQHLPTEFPQLDL